MIHSSKYLLNALLTLYFSVLPTFSFFALFSLALYLHLSFLSVILEVTFIFADLVEDEVVIRAAILVEIPSITDAAAVGTEYETRIVEPSLE